MSFKLLIFSKDRAFQLDACLRSLQMQTDIQNMDIEVLHASSNDLHLNQYKKLSYTHKQIQFTEEQNFKEDVIHSIKNNDWVMFGVDDNLYTRPWDVIQICKQLKTHKEAIGFSLRLGKNINFCYPHQKEQNHPKMDDLGSGIMSYEWPGKPYDFGYPMEVSSSIYRVNDILSSIEKQFEVKNPNQLEDCLVEYGSTKSSDKPVLLCYEESRVFACPINIVQNTNQNLYGLTNGIDSDILARYLNNKQRLDLSILEAFTPNSCHQEIAFRYETF